MGSLGSGRGLGFVGSAGEGTLVASVVHVFVLGIDPGLSRCGYGAVRATAAGPRAEAIGVIRTDPHTPLPTRLAELQRELRDLIGELRPDAVAVERVFFQVNVRTAMSVGQASGLAMAEAIGAGCEVVQYSPNEVKLAVTGDGSADKAQVQSMVRRLLALRQEPRPADAADAAALALCHLARSGLARRVAVAASTGARR